jgi:hypothetical protein
MSPPDTDSYAVLCAADPDLMDRDELAVLTNHLAQHQAWCDAIKVRVTRRQRQLAAEGRAEPARDLLSRHGRQSSKDAKAAADREQVCTSLPSFEDALAAGMVSAGHVDAIANATRQLDERPGNAGRQTSAIDSTTAADLNRRVVHNATHSDPEGHNPRQPQLHLDARNPLAQGQPTRAERPVRIDLSGVTMDAWETIRSIVSIGWNVISRGSNSKSAS